jgi:hypothetical protein
MWGLIHSQGEICSRLDDLERLRLALLDGNVPSGLTWPDPVFASELLSTLSSLEMFRFCKGEVDIVDSLLRSMMFHLDHVVDYMDRGAAPEVARQMALDAFATDWKERRGEMDELVNVFGSLGDLVKHTRWDLLRGLLHSQGWQEVVRIRALLERLPEFSRIITKLGRSRASEDPDDSSRSDTPVMEQITSFRSRHHTVRVPDYPGETRGVRRSGRVARMLPAEAMLLNHPRLRLIWHARHAERILLTYEDDERMDDALPEPIPAWRPRPDKAPDQRMDSPSHWGLFQQ